jgi:hypothetical protein
MSSLSTISGKADFSEAIARRDRFTKPLFDAANPFAAKLVCDITDNTVESAIATMRRAAFKGADVFNLNVSLIGYEKLEELSRIFDGVKMPVFTAVRRASFLPVYGGTPFPPRQQTEAERVDVHLRCLDFGSVGVDMELDTFHTDKGSVSLANEIAAGVDQERASVLGPIGDVSFDEDAIGQQKEAIRQIKSRGGFVIMSTHTARPINTSEVLLIARSAAERGADYVKMVVRTRSQEDQDELVRASLALRKEISIPFILMPMGRHTVATRLTLFTLGAGWAITQAEFVPGGFHQQPLIETWLPIIRALRAS